MELSILKLYPQRTQCKNPNLSSQKDNMLFYLSTCPFFQSSKIIVCCMVGHALCQALGIKLLAKKFSVFMKFVVKCIGFPSGPMYFYFTYRSNSLIYLRPCLYHNWNIKSQGGKATKICIESKEKGKNHPGRKEKT